MTTTETLKIIETYHIDGDQTYYWKSIEEALKFHPTVKNQKLIPEIQRLINEESV